MEFSRKIMGLSQKKIAEIIGISTKTVLNYEKNDTLPDTGALIKWAQAVNCNPGWLLTGKGSMEAVDEQKAKLDIRAEAQMKLDEAYSQYHDCLDLILTKGKPEQRKAAVGMLAVGANEIIKKEGLKTTPMLGETKYEAFAQYHRCLDLILTKGATELQRDTVGMLVVESDEIRERERDASSENKTEKD